MTDLESGVGMVGAPDAYVFPSAETGGDAARWRLIVVVGLTADASGIAK